MKRLLGCSALFGCLLVTGQVRGQGVQRDPQAIQVLTQCVNAVGGLQAVNAIQDFTATGSVTFPGDNPLQGTVTVYGKGLTEFRMDSSLQGGTQSFIVNSGGGELVDVNGNTTAISALNLMTAGSLAIPAIRAADVLNDTTIGVAYVGPVTWNGIPAIQVHVTLPVNSTLSSLPGLSTLGNFDLYADATSYQIVGLTESIWPASSLAQPLSHQMQFSSYSVLQGNTLPTGITEMVDGQTTWSVTLSGIEFNSGLQDSLFNFGS